MPKLLIAFFLLYVTGLSAQNKPNIILIMADDLGWGDVGYNGNQLIQTPHLDQMAKDGITFNRFYSASAVCSPTRASVLTGRNPYRTGVFTANKGILRKEELTIPELLKEEGYTSGHFGKWHLGTLTTAVKDANRGRPNNMKEYNPPAWHGYDEAFVTESKVPTYDPMKKPVDGASRLGWDYLKEGQAYKSYGTHYWDFDGNIVSNNLEGDDSRVIMDRVLPFIDKALEKEQPFCAVVWFHTPHLPCVAGPKYQALYKEQPKMIRNYAGCVTAMDEQIGRLRKYLLKHGIGGNTMIWFCSDNGPENNSTGTTGGFKARKRSLYEGGVRVPGLLVWPDKVKEGFAIDAPAVTSDYLPTIMDALDITSKKVPYILDGESLMPVIEHKRKIRDNAIGFCFRNMVSSSDNRYKLYVQDGQYELYDLHIDPYEKSNVIDDEPLVAKQLKEELNAFLESCQSSFEGGEYGQDSYNKLEQKWPDPLMKK